MAWSFRYAAHLGYAPPAFRPQFAATCGTADPQALIRFAAEIGMAGILYPWAITRPDPEVEAVRRTLAETGLACSCIVALPPELIATPIWTDVSATGRDRLQCAIARAATLAARLGSSTLAVLIGADTSRTSEAQIDDVAGNLRQAAHIAADHGVGIGVEPIILLPDMLLHTTKTTIDLLRRTDHASAGMIFDTGHVHGMDGDIQAAFNLARDHIRLIQFADMPGRVEPGAGNLDLVGFGSELFRSGFDGLIDLEHGWVDESLAGEEWGLARLRDFDRKVAIDATSQRPKL